ncbi:MAG TPA: hypothetical protein VLL95_10490 [Phnomibacter sp.]|nr:hypothetical protein [Phnomibacter sp.]
MALKSSASTNMRVIHRYLGFFLCGIMAVYALSGILLIYRDTDLLKKEKQIEKLVAPNLEDKAIGEAIGLKQLKIINTTGDTVHFENGTYTRSSGKAVYTVKELPYVLSKMTKLHKAKSAEPLYFLNIFFGISLLFFVVSTFWMFAPKSSIFKKGLYFTLAGVILTLALLFW